jgi:DNA-binding CsgD family transcriptional regulator
MMWIVRALLPRGARFNGRSSRVTHQFQAANEELEMPKDDLKSRNEELTALNGRLLATVERQRAASRDLQNILDSTDMATLFLDADLNIRFFTPAARLLFTIANCDVGRPLAGLSRRFEDDDDLLPDAQAVLASHTPVRRAVRSGDGSWFIRATLPYQSDGSGIEGVVITVADMSEFKAGERGADAARETAATRMGSLTTRQRQILDLVLAGHPSKNIAADLGISQRTVDNHRAAIMKKTGSKSLPALVRTALAAA